MSILTPSPLPQQIVQAVDAKGVLVPNWFNALSSLRAKVVSLVSYVGAGPSLAADLPSAATAGAGARAFVTDATATTFHSVVAGTGANKVPVVSDGTNWLIG